MSTSSETQQKLTFMHVVKSVLDAGNGLQSGENRRRDFELGSPVSFIIVGIVTTIFFVLIVFGVVRLFRHFAAV